MRARISTHSGPNEGGIQPTRNFGGHDCQVGRLWKLERHLYDKDTVVNPTTPEEDFHEKFMWKYVQMSVFHNATYDEAETLALNGWSFTKCIKLNSQQLCLYYRKRRV